MGGIRQIRNKEYKRNPKEKYQKKVNRDKVKIKDEIQQINWSARRRIDKPNASP